LSLPRKLGQHFLVRDSILVQLASAACGEHTPRVVEVGPGRGALTRHLLPRTDELHAIELDANLVRNLLRKFQGQEKLHVHHSDVLETDLSQWGPAVVAGNLPYYITSPIIERFLALDHRFPAAVFLVQWEVAQRLLARPGTRDYGFLSVSTQLVCDVELVCRVPAAAFDPPPKVESGAVKLHRKTETTPDLQALVRFAGRCFTHKRKTLRNNLRPFYGQLIDDLPEAGLRAEQLDLDRFKSLHSTLSELLKNGVFTYEN
jgi:16S rRNA (adenine1518-N6/adenine1519-N6)-dimethyltransferase